MLTHDQFVAEAAKIPYQYRHPQFLYALVKWLRPIWIVEVGTHIGMSAVWLARGLQENRDGRLVCIDSFCWADEEQEEQWRHNISTCGVQERVTLFKGRSQVVDWPIRVDMAFIDGNHDYDVCSWDVYKAKTMGATCIALHDTVQCDGTRRLSEVMRKWEGWDCLEVNFDAGLLVALKREKKGPVTDFKDQWDKRPDEEQRKLDWEPLPNFQGE
jgi:predicted O-methyltransferase YrrM